MFVATEAYCQRLGHSWRNKPLFISFQRKARLLRLQDSDALRNGCSIDDPDCGRVRFIKFISCEFDFGRVDDYEGVACGLLKLIWLENGVHFAARVLASLVSDLRRSELGRKVALSYRPVLVSWSVMDV